MGYAVQGKTQTRFHRNFPEEAERVRNIFQPLPELGSVHTLQAELAAQGHGPGPDFRRWPCLWKHELQPGALYQMLANRIYLGEITHRDKAYPGEHAGIIDAATFEQVSALLAGNRVIHRHAAHAGHPSLLAGIWDGDGRRMTPNHANKNGTRYRYYISSKDKERLSLPCPPPAGWLISRTSSSISFAATTDANWGTPSPPAR
ncbi:recombinase family protein [Novosphingobium sp.]|uniref:recombinase family protein n=1 Tax=Novosphingobium sp. TaxID=1874826 RepID=UPI001EBA38BD|nr:recombinase family protein [Novosphingobium sp.]MBK9011255.1 recombinase family protein [Novosphingobium sp.]